MLPRSSRLVLATSRSSSSTSSLLRLASTSRLTVRAESGPSPPPHRSFATRSSLLSSRRSWENPVSKEDEQASAEQEGEQAEEAEEEGVSADGDPAARGGKDDGAPSTDKPATSKRTKKQSDPQQIEDTSEDADLTAEERAKGFPEGYFVKNEESHSSAASSSDKPTPSPTDNSTTIDPNLPPSPPANAGSSSKTASQGRTKVSSPGSSRLTAASLTPSSSPKQLKSSIVTPEREATKQEIADEAAALLEMDEILILPAGMLSLPPFKKSELTRLPRSA